MRVTDEGFPLYVCVEHEWHHRASRTLARDADAARAEALKVVQQELGESRGDGRLIYFMHYNFGRVHQTLRVMPAMDAGTADHVWSIEDIVGLLV